jgi:hypothetical protein
MKKFSLFLVVVVVFFSVQQSAVFAQQPRLSIDRSVGLQLFGHTNNSYRIQSSDDLMTWTNHEYFTFSNTPYTQTVDYSISKKFYRAQALFTVINNSYVSPCAEYDSVDVPIRGDVTKFSIIATHPTYTVTNYTSREDFSNCPQTPPDTNYDFVALPPNGVKIFDNGTDYLVVKRGAQFWRPQGMFVAINGVTNYSDIHYIEIGRRIPGANEWPIFFVLYEDGNVRLIPFPPLGQNSVTFGTSVIVGPAPVAYRPYVEIRSVNYHTATRKLDIEYYDDGSSTLEFSTVTRTNSVVKVAVNYPTAEPFCTIRSMFVETGNCDVDTLIWKDLDGSWHTNSIMSLTNDIGTEWFSTRLIPSKHNNSSSDIRIVLD